MMNYIWPLMIILSLICAIFSGKLNALSNAVIASSGNAVSLVIKLAGVICLWNGLSEIAEKSGLTQKLCKLLSPFLTLIFPKLKDEKAKEAIAMNITANLLGLGNAATPLGIDAMKRLQKNCESTERASDEMVRFVVINSAAVHLIPTTVAMLRSEYGSASPMSILLPALTTSVCALSAGLLASHFLKRFF